MVITITPPPLEINTAARAFYILSTRDMSVRLVCYYCPRLPEFRDNSGKLLCSGCNAVEEGGAVQQRPREQRHCGGVAPDSDCFTEFVEETRRAVEDLAFNSRAGGDDKRAHD